MIGIVSSLRPSNRAFAVPAKVFQSTFPAPFSTCALRSIRSAQSSRRDSSRAKNPALARSASSVSGLGVLQDRRSPPTSPSPRGSRPATPRCPRPAPLAPARAVRRSRRPGSSSDNHSGAVTARGRNSHIPHASATVDQTRGRRLFQNQALGQSHGNLLLERFPRYLDHRVEYVRIHELPDRFPCPVSPRPLRSPASIP